MSSNYVFPNLEATPRYEYSRATNPTRDLLAEALARLEGGTGAIVTSSGTSAVDLALSLLRPGELVVAPHDCYGGTYRLLAARQARGHFMVRFINQNDKSEVATALAARPALLLIETPSNPLMRVVNIRQLCEQARAAGALSAVDNTFLSPALQRPLTYGADLVIHSTTKFINGHSDVLGGAVVAADQSHYDKLYEWANTVGVTGSAFDAHMTLRGLRTLFSRVTTQQKTAMLVANLLKDHPAVERVYYPGLPCHPDHELATQQQAGFGSMLSFELSAGASGRSKFVGALRNFLLAESLGGVESLIAHPASMTHRSMGDEAMKAAGITDRLFRLSVGLEHEDDLLSELTSALDLVGE